ncbi:hypothetical protein IAG25_31895 [Caballeronia sp. EK]|uniref:hypothetical protein n=1 Tax=Caballeronia sp. EK TaxID=2767469 RepID=UPI001655D9E2|nr:hypothetical protein [Caballeronia sp. EK]MBC8641424.1 hypothetical protein [Caballeronia sp. EK]
MPHANGSRNDSTLKRIKNTGLDKTTPKLPKPGLTREIHTHDINLYDRRIFTAHAVSPNGGGLVRASGKIHLQKSPKWQTIAAIFMLQLTRLSVLQTPMPPRFIVAIHRLEMAHAESIRGVEPGK